jgi:hypothetical protein
MREDDDGEREIESVVAAADESRDAAIASPAAQDSQESASIIQHLVAGVSVQRTASGGLLIEAKPESASTLAALFSGMAQLLRAAAAPALAGGDPLQNRRQAAGSSGGDARRNAGATT